MGGRIVDENRDVYYLLPDLDLEDPIWRVILSPTAESLDSEASETPVRSQAFAYSTATSSQVTATEWATYIGNASKVIDTELTPGQQNATTTFTMEDDPHNVTFMMVTETGSGIDLNVYDDVGRHVGPDEETGTDEVQIPNATYTGNQTNPERVTIRHPNDVSSAYELTIDASRFTTDEPVSVDVFAITEPTRPPILGVTPASVQLASSPGETESVNLTVAEVGDQRNVTGVSLQPSTFTTDDGQSLPAEASLSLSEQAFDLPKGQEQAVRATLDTTSLSSVTTRQTRYNGTITVESDTVQPLVANISVLLLDSADPNVELVGGDLGVDGVHMTNTTDTTSLPDGLPENVTPVRSYSTDIVGNGNVTIRATGFDYTAGARLFGYTGDQWIALNSSESTGLVTTDIPARVQTLVVARPTISVTVDVVAGANRTAVSTQSTTAGQQTAFQLTQQTYGAELVSVSASASTGETVSTSERNPVEWSLTTELDENSFNTTSGTYDTVTVEVTAEGRTRTVTKNVSLEIRAEGDANGDGRVDIFDAVTIGRNWQAVAGDPNYSYAADLNNDGVIDIFDAVVIGRNWQTSAA
jgi:hypothetical protein